MLTAVVAVAALAVVIGMVLGVRMTRTRRGDDIAEIVALVVQLTATARQTCTCGKSKQRKRR